MEWYNDFINEKKETFKNNGFDLNIYFTLNEHNKFNIYLELLSLSIRDVAVFLNYNLKDYQLYDPKITQDRDTFEAMDELFGISNPFLKFLENTEIEFSNNSKSVLLYDDINLTFPFKIEGDYENRKKLNILTKEIIRYLDIEREKISVELYELFLEKILESEHAKIKTSNFPYKPKKYYIDRTAWLGKVISITTNNDITIIKYYDANNDRIYYKWAFYDFIPSISYNSMTETNISFNMFIENINNPDIFGNRFDFTLENIMTLIKHL